MTRDSRDRQAGNVLAWIEGVLAAMGATCSPGRAGKWQCPGARPHRRARPVAGARGPRRRRGVGVLPRRLQRQGGLPYPGPDPRPATAAAGGSPRSQGYRHEGFQPYGPDVRLERLRHPVTGDKAIQWERRNDHGQWVWGLPEDTREADLPLYREHEVRAAVALGETVLLVESESSADALTGWYATTWAGGAAVPPLERIAELLAEHDQVVVIGDADDPGRRCTTRISEVLPRAAVLTSEREGEDARDLHTRLGADGFAELVTAALTDHPATQVA